MQREDIKKLVQKWWDIYNDLSLDYKRPLTGAEGQTDGVDVDPFVAALSEAGQVHYITAPSAA